MSAEEKNTWLEYQMKPDEKLFVLTFRMDARLPAFWLSTAYLEPLFPTGNARIAKNTKKTIRRSLSWRWCKNFVVSGTKKPNRKRRTTAQNNQRLLFYWKSLTVVAETDPLLATSKKSLRLFVRPLHSCRGLFFCMSALQVSVRKPRSLRPFPAIGVWQSGVE